MANIIASVQGGSTITISLDRSASGVGIESVELVTIESVNYLEFTYTNGTTELVALPALASGVVTFNTRAGNVTLEAADVNTALGYTAGNVTGSASSTDNAIARFDSTTGKLIQNSTVTVSDNGDVSSVNAVEFDTTPTTLPTAPGTLFWDNANNAQTLSLVMTGGNAIQQVGQEQYIRVKATSAITEGQVVMFTGSVGASGGLTGAPATGLIAENAQYIMGVATENIALNEWGYVTTFGVVRNINTTGGAEAWVDGQILYLNPSVVGGLTKILPTAPNPKVVVCAVDHAATNGSLFVRLAFGGLLGQFEGDVNITNPANGQLLVRDQTTGKWVNATLTDGTGISVTEGAGSVTVTNTAPDQVVSITGSGTTTVTGTYPNFTVSSDDQFDGTVTSVGGTGTVNGISLSGTVTSSGNLTLGGALTGVDLTTQVTGTLPIASGGTNATTASGARTSLGLGTSAVLDAAVALGTATLDAAGTVPLSQIPAAILGSLIYQGTWNASTNTPTLVSSVGTKGYYYVVSAAGSTNLNGITDWKIGDWVIFDGAAWGKVDNTDSVNSVNGYTGTVVLGAADVGAYPDTNPSGYTTNTGTVTSVAATAGTGISVTGSPITSSGNLTITNTAPDQVVALTSGTGISASGTYPNFTITNTAPDQVVSLTPSTGISITGTYPNYTIASTAIGGTVTSVAATVPSFLSVSGSPITTSGTLALTYSGTALPVANGGTGATSAAAALTSLGAYSDTNPSGYTTNTGTVTSVGATAGTGISVTGSPITSSGSLTITNTAPDQVVSLTGAGTTVVTGTYPNFTLTTNDEFDGTVTSVGATAGTGISVTGSPITSSGSLTITNTAPDQVVALTSGTGISTSGTYPNFTITNTAPDQTVSLTGAGTSVITGTYPSFTITTNDEFDGTVTSVGGTGTVNGLTLTGTVTSSGNLTLGGALSGVDLTTQVTGTLPVANGGTGITSFGAGVATFLGTPSSANLASAVTGETGSGALVFGTSPTLASPTFNDGYTEEVFAVTGATPALSPANGSIQTWTLSGNSTPIAGTWNAGQSITLMVDDGSAATVTWTSLAVTWKTDGGTAPTLNTSGYTVITLWKVDTTIYGARVGDA